MTEEIIEGRGRVHPVGRHDGSISILVPLDAWKEEYKGKTYEIKVEMKEVKEDE